MGTEIFTHVKAGGGSLKTIALLLGLRLVLSADVFPQFMRQTTVCALFPVMTGVKTASYFSQSYRVANGLGPFDASKWMEETQCRRLRIGQSRQTGRSAAWKKENVLCSSFRGSSVKIEHECSSYSAYKDVHFSYQLVTVAVF